MGRTELKIIVLDAGPLIHLDELGALSLLSDFSRLIVADAVWKEVTTHRPNLFRSSSIRFRRTSPPVEPLSPTLKAIAKMFPLHRGETEALRIALAQNANLLLTDDTAARLAARQLGIRVHGTLGILLRAVRTKQRTPEDIIRLLQGLPTRSTLHVKRVLLNEIIQQVQQFESKP